MEINIISWVKHLKYTATRLQKQSSLEEKRTLYEALGIDIFLGFFIIRKLIEDGKLKDWSVKIENCRNDKDKNAAKTGQMPVHEISSRIIHSLTYKVHISEDSLRFEGIYFNSRNESDLIYLSLSRVIQIFNSADKDLPCITISRRTGKVRFYKKKTLRFPKDHQ